MGLNRFRMNIEISGCSKPFEEDEWLVVKIGSVPFLCYRDAEVGNEPILLHVCILHICKFCEFSENSFIGQRAQSVNL